MKLTDLSTGKKANEGVFLHLPHPVTGDLLFDEDKVPVGFTMLGSDSDTFIEQNNAITDKYLDPKTSKTKVTAASSDDQAARILAAMVTSKDWNIPTGWVLQNDDETPIAFSADNAYKMFCNPGVRWLREKANLFSGTRANFL